MIPGKRIERESFVTANSSRDEKCQRKNLTEKEESQGETIKKKKIRFSYNEQREFDTIEEDIAILEEKLKEIGSELAKHASDFEKLGQLTIEQKEAEQRLDEKMERWAYLTELAEKIENGEIE